MVPLSKRELEVAGFIALGKIEKEIADKLCISMGTVHTHKQSIYRKTGAKTTADVTRIISEMVTKRNISQLIREEIIEPNVRKIITMLLFLFLHLAATFDMMDIRSNRGRINRVNRTIRARRVEY